MDQVIRVIKLLIFATDVLSELYRSLGGDRRTLDEAILQERASREQLLKAIRDRMPEE